MATAAEMTLRNSISVAEGIRQVAKAAALATFQAAGFAAGSFATYAAALQTADNAYITSVNSALNTASLVGYTTPNSGPSQANVEPGNLGLTGPVSPGFSIGSAYASAGFGAIA